MKTAYWLVSLSIGLGVVTGCGGDDSSGNGTQSNGGSGGTQSTGGTGASGGTATGGTGNASSGGTGGTAGAAGDGNDDFGHAVGVSTDGTPLQDELSPAESDADYFVFDGTAGTPMRIELISKSGTSNPFDPTYPDYVLELFDAEQNRIARNDDPQPQRTQDPLLYTVLPSTGKYYVRISDFCAKSPASCPSNYFSQLSHFNYFLKVNPVDFSAAGNTKEAPEPNDNTAGAPVTYVLYGNDPGVYAPSIINGVFDQPGDVDTFLIDLPDDQAFDTRPAVQVDVHESGAVGNGATTGITKLELVDEMGTVYASVDPTQGQLLSPPADLATKYTLRVSPSPNALGSNPFYFASVGSTAFTGELELAEPNDGTLKELTGVEGVGTIAFFAEGDLAPAATDQDDFELAVDTAGVQADIVCGAERSGSGLRGLSFSLSDQDGSAVPGGTSPDESATGEARIDNLVLPAGTTKLRLKVQATAQDPNVSSTFYRCGVTLHAPGS